MTPSHLHRYTGGLTIFVVLLAVLNLTRVPDAAAASIAACVTMFAIWGVVGLKTKFSSRAHLSEVEQTFFIAAVMFAGLLLLTSLAAKLLGHIYDIDADLLKRGRNVLIGLGLLFFANLMMRDKWGIRLVFIKPACLWANPNPGSRDQAYPQCWRGVANDCPRKQL